MNFDTYGEDTITEILSRRAREGLGPNAVAEHVYRLDVATDPYQPE